MRSSGLRQRRGKDGGGAGFRGGKSMCFGALVVNAD